MDWTRAATFWTMLLGAAVVVGIWALVRGGWLILFAMGTVALVSGVQLRAERTGRHL